MPSKIKHDTVQQVPVPGQPVPDFTLPATGKRDFTLSQERGKALVLYFYPRDSTPGCTTEAQQFRDLHTQFRAAGCEIYGISRDAMRSHEGFKAKLDLPFELLSDVEETACAVFGVVRQKILYGKQVRGIERSTFVIDGEGVLRHEWRKVNAQGHAAEVLETVKTLEVQRSR